MASEGTTNNNIRERTVKLQQDAAALQQQIAEHFEYRHGRPSANARQTDNQGQSR